MGRYSDALAPKFAEAADVAPGQRVLDVGCGAGALTTVLAQIVGADHLAGVDPSEPFVAAARKRVPGADLRVAPAESLPFQDGTFDRAVSQLVFHFVDDPPQAVAEMRRVTREGGRVAACVWDMTGGMTMLRSYWDAAREVDASAPDEIERFGGRPGQVAALWREAGLRDVVDDEIVVAARYRDFGELWAAFLGGVGPIGAHVSSLDDGQRAEVAAALRRRIGSPEGPFELSARAWLALGTV
ncbi:MAG TPA: methyltransferase domain-containing protein [Gaiellaceae bacterium]|nr:methyltransferase domain-containing protein [Gaiellaceae bacterium]